MRLFCGLALAALLLAGCYAHAAVLTATPTNWTGPLAALQGGDTLAFVGDFSGAPVVVRDRVFSPPATFDRTSATFGQFYLVNVTGLEVLGGATVAVGVRAGDFVSGSHQVHISGASCSSSDPAAVYCVALRSGTDLSYEQGTITGTRAAIFILQANQVRARWNEISHSRGDGIEVGSADGVDVSFNHCSDPATAAGTHPDCVQILNPVNSGGLGVSNIRIWGNYASGAWQLANAFAGARNVDVRGNYGHMGMPQGLAFTGVTGTLVIRDNHLSTQTGSAFITTINVVAPPADFTRCGNIVEPFKGWPGVVEPKCPDSAP